MKQAIEFVPWGWRIAWADGSYTVRMGGLLAGLWAALRLWGLECAPWNVRGFKRIEADPNDPTTPKRGVVGLLSDGEHVPAGAECPECGESRMDWLVWEGESIECQRCGTVYYLLLCDGEREAWDTEERRYMIDGQFTEEEMQAIDAEVQALDDGPDADPGAEQRDEEVLELDAKRAGAEFPTYVGWWGQEHAEY